MTYPPNPDRSAYGLRPVRAGEPYTRAVEGGHVRTRAPADGVIVVQDDREVFIPAIELRRALAQLGHDEAPPPAVPLREVRVGATVVRAVRKR